MESDRALTDAVSEHCRELVARETVDSIERETTDLLVYAAGTISGEREPDWLAPGEVRLGGVERRDDLFRRYGVNNDFRLVWNVGEFDAVEWPLIAHMMDEHVYQDTIAISERLSARYGADAEAPYLEQFEIALREVPWSRWFNVTDDFVVFTWDGSYGHTLRRSLERNASPAAIRRWSARGWMP